MGIFRRIFALGKRDSVRTENERELREHMGMRVDANVAKGMSPEEALREARLRFGNPGMVRERVDAEDAALGLESVLRDVRYALRGFAKSPGFTTVAIVTLALGIGANTAVFQLLDAVRLRSLPIAAPGELAEVRIAGGNKGFGVTDGPYARFTIPMWLEVRSNHEPFSGVFAWRETTVMVGKVNEAKQVNGIEVSGEYFNVLGVTPWQGRLIQPQDEAGCQISKVVVSYPYWKSQMGSEPITPNTTVTIGDSAGAGRDAAEFLRRGGWRPIRSRLSDMHAAQSAPRSFHLQRDGKAQAGMDDGSRVGLFRFAERRHL